MSGQAFPFCRSGQQFFRFPGRQTALEPELYGFILASIASAVKPAALTGAAYPPRATIPDAKPENAACPPAQG